MNVGWDIAATVHRRTVVARGPAKYLAALVGGAAFALATFCGLYGLLYATGYLPPPPLSNNVCTDEKLAFLRQNPPPEPNLLIVGSSVAWRNIDSSVLARDIPGTTPLNAGFCGMQVHQSAFIADWLLAHWPAIDRLLLVVSPLDFNACRGTDEVFDQTDANRFVFEGAVSWSFYLRYFDPVSLNRNIRRQQRDREEARALKVERRFTQYGDGPLDTNENRGLFYGPMPALDPSCFAALHAFAAKMTSEGRRLSVVLTPLHPEWKTRYDEDGSFRAAFERQVEAALTGTDVAVWNADEAELLDAAAFTDAIHVRWSSAAILTRAIGVRLRSGV